MCRLVGSSVAWSVCCAMHAVSAPLPYQSSAAACLRQHVTGLPQEMLKVTDLIKADFWEGDATKHFSVKKCFVFFFFS